MKSLTGSDGGSSNDVPNDTVLTLAPPLIDDEEEPFELVDMPLRPGELDLVLLQYDFRLIDVDSTLHLTFVHIDSLETRVRKLLDSQEGQVNVILKRYSALSSSRGNKL